jgi:superfamily II DNA/RNA helicase
MYDRTRVDEVEIISSEINDTRKELIKEAFLDGVVKIIIGTATIREGIDLQKRGTVIYNCYPEWNPTDIRQLEGRIWRQGNQFKYVRIVMPLVQDSMDVFVFQKLEEKTSRINDIWFRGDRGNVLDLESLNPEEIKLALITDVDRLVRMFFDQEREQLYRDGKRAQLALEAIRTVQRDIQEYRSYREKSLEDHPGVQNVAARPGVHAADTARPPRMATLMTSVTKRGRNSRKRLRHCCSQATCRTETYWPWAARSKTATPCWGVYRESLQPRVLQGVCRKGAQDRENRPETKGILPEQ